MGIFLFQPNSSDDSLPAKRTLRSQTVTPAQATSIQEGASDRVGRSWCAGLQERKNDGGLDGVTNLSGPMNLEQPGSRFNLRHRFLAAD